MTSYARLKLNSGLRDSGLGVVARRLKSLSWFSFLSGIALSLGFLRELFVARQYGLSAELDVFIAVSGIYLFLGTQVGNTLETTIVSQWQRIPDVQDRRALLISATGQLLLFVAVAIALILVFFNEGFALLFPSLSAAHSHTASIVMYGLSVAVVFASTAGLMRGVLYALRVFTPGMIGGAIISLCSIIAMAAFSRWAGIYSLVVGIAVGNAVLLIWYVALLVRKGWLRVSGLSRGVLPLRPFWMGVLVVLAGEILFQIYGLSQRSIASRFEVGTVSAFFYATSIMLVPLALVVTPLLTSIYPKLVDTLSKDRTAGTRLVLGYGGLSAAFAVVVAAVLAAFAQDLVHFVFVRGAFSAEAAERTGDILAVLSASLPFLVLARLVRYALYSLSDYLTPVIGNLISVVALLVLARWAVPLYGVTGLAGSAVASAALGTIFPAAVLLLKLRHD